MTESEKTVIPAIEIVNLSKNYGSRVALDDISFKVNKGEIVGFLGPNGAGKSTTMNIIAGYIASSGGKVIIDGIDITDNPGEAKKKIGYLPEIPPLYTDMTVLEYLSFVYDLKLVKEKKSEHLERIMETVGISDVKKRLIVNLSKGYKQRVGLAQALIGDPEILILDEPTVGLDPQQIMEVRDVITEVGKSRTVILSTHIMQEVAAVCNRYVIINKGKIIASESLDSNADGSMHFRLRIKGNEENVVITAQRLVNIADISVEGCVEAGTTDLLINSKGDKDIRTDIFNVFADAHLPIIMFEKLEHTLEETFINAISR